MSTSDGIRQIYASTLLVITGDKLKDFQDLRKTKENIKMCVWRNIDDIIRTEMTVRYFKECHEYIDELIENATKDDYYFMRVILYRFEDDREDVVYNEQLEKIIAIIKSAETSTNIPLKDLKFDKLEGDVILKGLLKFRSQCNPNEDCQLWNIRTNEWINIVDKGKDDDDYSTIAKTGNAITNNRVFKGKVNSQGSIAAKSNVESTLTGRNEYTQGNSTTLNTKLKPTAEHTTTVKNSILENSGLTNIQYASILGDYISFLDGYLTVDMKERVKINDFKKVIESAKYNGELRAQIIQDAFSSYKINDQTEEDDTSPYAAQYEAFKKEKTEKKKIFSFYKEVLDTIQTKNVETNELYKIETIVELIETIYDFVTKMIKTTLLTSQEPENKSIWMINVNNTFKYISSLKKENYTKAIEKFKEESSNIKSSFGESRQNLTQQSEGISQVTAEGLFKIQTKSEIIIPPMNDYVTAEGIKVLDKYSITGTGKGKTINISIVPYVLDKLITNRISNERRPKVILEFMQNIVNILDSCAKRLVELRELSKNYNSYDSKEETDLTFQFRKLFKKTLENALDEQNRTNISVFLRINDRYYNKGVANVYNPRFYIGIEKDTDNIPPNSMTFGYNHSLGILPKEEPEFLNKSELRKAVVEPHGSINAETFKAVNADKHRRFYKFGRYSEIFTPELDNKQIAIQHSVETDIVQKLKDGKDIFVLGYGSSGAGKTSSLINLNLGKGNKKSGIIVEICNTIQADSINVTIIEQCHKTAAECLADDVKFHENSIYGEGEYTSKILIKCKNIKFKKSDDDSNWIVDESGIDESGIVKGIQDLYFKSRAGKRVGITVNATTTLSELLELLIDIDRHVMATPNNPQSSRSHVLAFIKFQNISGIKQRNPTLTVGDFAGVENKFDYNDLDNILIKFANQKNRDKIIYNCKELNNDLGPKFVFEPTESKHNDKNRTDVTGRMCMTHYTDNYKDSNFPIPSNIKNDTETKELIRHFANRQKIKKIIDTKNIIAPLKGALQKLYKEFKGLNDDDYKNELVSTIRPKFGLNVENQGGSTLAEFLSDNIEICGDHFDAKNIITFDNIQTEIIKQFTNKKIGTEIIETTTPTKETINVITTKIVLNIGRIPIEDQPKGEYVEEKKGCSLKFVHANKEEDHGAAPPGNDNINSEKYKIITRNGNSTKMGIKFYNEVKDIVIRIFNERVSKLNAAYFTSGGKFTGNLWDALGKAKIVGKTTSDLQDAFKKGVFKETSFVGGGHIVEISSKDTGGSIAQVTITFESSAFGYNVHKKDTVYNLHKTKTNVNTLDSETKKNIITEALKKNTTSTIYPPTNTVILDRTYKLDDNIINIKQKINEAQSGTTNLFEQETRNKILQLTTDEKNLFYTAFNYVRYRLLIANALAKKRSIEGYYINKSLSDLREDIKRNLFLKNKDVFLNYPSLERECLKYHCMNDTCSTENEPINHTKDSTMSAINTFIQRKFIMGNKNNFADQKDIKYNYELLDFNKPECEDLTCSIYLDKTMENETTREPVIGRRLLLLNLYYNTDAKLTSEAVEESLKKTNIVIFGVLNIAIQSSDPPPLEYFDINHVKKAISNKTINQEQAKNIILLFLKNKNIIPPEIFTYLRDLLVDLFNIKDDQLENDGALTEYYNKQEKDENDTVILEDLTKFIDNYNAPAALSTLEFFDNMISFLRTEYTCEVPKIKLTSKDAKKDKYSYKVYTHSDDITADYMNTIGYYNYVNVKNFEKITTKVTGGNKDNTLNRNSIKKTLKRNRIKNKKTRKYVNKY